MMEKFFIFGQLFSYDMLGKIIIFILFLGPLVFFHELGHFLFARLFGVKVEVFSIGFGPKLFRWKPGETEYTVSIIPLGGYVKMFGDNIFEKDKVPPEEREQSFSHKGKWPRFWIVMGGPLANFILTWFIFFGLIFFGEKTPEIRLGFVTPESFFYSQGLRSGDVIKEINGAPISHPSDLPTPGDDPVRKLDVLRLDNAQSIKVDFSAKKFFEEFQKHPPFLRKPLVVNAEGERFWPSLHPDKVDKNMSLPELGQYPNENRTFYFYKVEGESATAQTPSFSLVSNTTGMEDFLKWLAKNALRPIELMVENVQEGGAAAEVGILKGDTVVSFNGKDIVAFNDLRKNLENYPKDTVRLAVWRGGQLKSFDLRPQTKEINGKEVKLVGVVSSMEYLDLKLVKLKGQNFIASFMGAFKRTGDAIGKIVDGVKKIFVGDISLKQIGGPLRIGKVASDSFNTSVSYFFQIMAFISINLGIINLFPIPVLDGGHIMFIFLEIFNRKPLSRKKMEIAQQIGFSILIFLMVGALFNDFSWIFSN